MPQYNHRKISFVIAIIIIIADQLTKFWANNNLEYGIPLHLINDFFSLTLLYNDGAAFSIFSNQDGWQKFFLLGISATASIAIIVWLCVGQMNLWLTYGLGLILGGAVGNLIDRALYGYVIDFLDFYVGSWHWPAFNIADSGISIGAALLIIEVFRK